MYLPGIKNRKIPLVFEFSSFQIRTGYGGYDSPLSRISSLLGVDNENEEIQLLDYHQQKWDKNTKKLVTMFENHNKIENSEYLQRLIEKLYSDELQCKSEDHPLLIVEPAITSREYKIKLAEIMFEHFQVPHLQFHKAPLLTSYLFAKENLLIIDSGGYNTYVTPIQDGQINEKGVIRTNIGGEYLTMELKQILVDQNKKIINSSIKNDQSQGQQLQNFGQMVQIREIKHQICKCYENTNIDDLQFNPIVDSTIFELPDRQQIEISKEIYTIPELIFQENEYINYRGLVGLVEQSFEKVETDYKRELSQNIIFIGGNSLVNNLIERFQKELFITTLSGFNQKSKVYTASSTTDKMHSSWIGGSIMSSLSTFENFAMSQEDYQENGAIYIERKSLC